MTLPTADGPTIVRKLMGIMRQFKGRFAVVIFLQLSVALLGIVTPWVIGQSIDAVAAGTTAEHIRNLVIVLFAVVAIQGIMAYFGEFQAMKLGEYVFTTLRNRVVYGVTHLPLSVVEAAGTGDLLGRTTHDVDRIAGFVQRGISRIIIIIMTITVTMLAAFFVDPRVGFVVLVPVVPIYFIVRWMVRCAVPAYLAGSALYAGLSGVVSETVEQLRTVDSMNLGRNRLGRLDTLMREMWRNERYTAWIRALFMIMMVIAVYSPILISVLWGGFLMGHGLTTIGAVTAVALYAQQLRGPLNELGWWIDEIQFASASFSRIFGVEMLREDLADDEPAGPPEHPDGKELVVEEASFSYRDGMEVLHAVDLDVRPGETLAIVGPSGAGKSTLGRLVAGINAPGSGSLAIGGAEVTRIPEKERHHAVSLVTQEHHVFVGTVADNLRFAREDASAEEIREALLAVEASWVFDLPEGVDTKVGSGGKQLSPAEAQQIALARIVLLDPGMLVLDEATSLLDPTAARSLELALAHVLEGRTVISIAHRLYTAHDADRVAVMIDGDVVELGSHDELVARGGEYAKLWERWQQD
ncbi:MAG: ABC transporter ATP-binding protein [Ancrocorticia sp.]|uniref:ABC transporter ATP-binding protein n=1 Tax=Ancrocorticia sp. TaxID=2593684 RepID=UPI003F90D278